MILCKKCRQVPVVKLTSPFSVNYNCICGYEEEFSIKNFNENATKKVFSYCTNIKKHRESVKANIYCATCSEWVCHKCIKMHSNLSHLLRDDQSIIELKCKIHSQKMNLYCNDCHEYFCEKCFDIHRGHKYVNLNKFYVSNEVKEVLSNFNISKKKIDSGDCETKNKMTDFLISEIKRIDEAYRKNKIANEDLINFFQILVRNFQLSQSSPNYNVVMNLMNNASFNLQNYQPKKKDLQSDINSLVNYFEQNLIIKTSIDLKTIYPIKTLKDHKDIVRSVLLLADNKLATCSDDQDIRIYDNNFNYSYTIEKAHDDKVVFLSQTKNDNIISCSKDKTIKLWEIEEYSYHLIIKIDAHSKQVNKVISLSDGRIGSCSYDTTIKIWNSSFPYECYHTLEGHTNSVFSIIQLKNNLLASGSYDNTLIFWNVVDNSKVFEEKEIDGVKCSDNNSIVECQNDNLLIIGGYNIITVINYDNYTIIAKVIIDNASKICAVMSLRDGTIFCGSGKDFFHIDCGYHITMKKSDIHTGIITCLAPIGDGCFVSSSYDKSVKIWKY